MQVLSLSCYLVGAMDDALLQMLFLSSSLWKQSLAFR